MAVINMVPMFELFRQILDKFTFVPENIIDDSNTGYKRQCSDTRYLYHEIFKDPKDSIYGFVIVDLGWGNLIDRETNCWENMYRISYGRLRKKKNPENMQIYWFNDVEIDRTAFKLKYKWSSFKEIMYVSIDGRYAELSQEIHDMFKTTLYEILLEMV